MKTSKNYLKLWGIPVLLAAVTTLGLLLAIAGTGLWHIFSWIALSIPLYIMIRFGKKFFT